jgi:predicted nucleic acid-binding protein
MIFLDAGLSRSGSQDVSARDALHIAVMRRHGVETIMSFDRGFDRCPA